MTELEEAVYLGDLVKYECDPRYTREKITLLKDTDAPDLPVGQILEPSSTKFVICTTGASASAILLELVKSADIQAADVVAVALVRGPAIVDVGKLTINSSYLTAAKAALKALGILQFTGPVYTEG